MEGSNTARPLIMYIDLNSCFATIEQQARPLLRGRPVAVVNRRAEHATIITASYEAKTMGVTLGMALCDAKKCCPDLVGIESDPVKYTHVYHSMMSIMREYSAYVRMKSIDEGVIDFSQASLTTQQRDLVEIGHEIKQRLCDEIGCWMRCNVGIGTNRFLAKMAASLNKPDGLNVLTLHNINTVFARLTLQSLTGIAGANERRLNAVGIYTPLELLNASAESLQIAYKSAVLGMRWYKRLRGWEVDDTDTDLKSCGRQYVLERGTLSRVEQLNRLHALAEGVGAKLRSMRKVAYSVRLYIRTCDGKSWRAHYTAPLPFCSNAALWAIAKQLFADAPTNAKMLALTCYGLHNDVTAQLSLFGDELERERHIARAIDDVNNRWGEGTMCSGDTIGLREIVKTKIPFGSTRYM